MLFRLTSLGTINQKCVKDASFPLNDSAYHEYVQSRENWALDAFGIDLYLFTLYLIAIGSYVVCGNASSAQHCPTNATCLPDIGQLPAIGVANYDNFYYACITVFQVTLSSLSGFQVIIMFRSSSMTIGTYHMVCHWHPQAPLPRSSTGWWCFSGRSSSAISSLPSCQTHSAKCREGEPKNCSFFCFSRRSTMKSLPIAS